MPKPYSTRIERICPGCGKSFLVPSWIANSGRGKFCSRPCAFKNKPKRPAADRFWEKVRVCGSEECWLWLGAKNAAGYGEFPGWKESALASRISFELANGAIDPKLKVLHSCDNPPCVNPNHLFQGTQLANIRDAVSKLRHVYGERSHWSKLEEEQVIAIFNDPRSHAAISVEYAITPTNVGAIKRGISWKHLNLIAARVGRE